MTFFRFYIHNNSTSRKSDVSCKKAPRLSSFTAAEQGNVHALERFDHPSRTAKDGITPLHLAAPRTCLGNRHVAAENSVVATGSGATACTERAFRGRGHDETVADPACVAATRYGFGDYMTPLHKAAAGDDAGQLLVDALAAKDELRYALVAVDNIRTQSRWPGISSKIKTRSKEVSLAGIVAGYR
jgi:hypothetical protein